jgi:phage-related protein
MALSGSIEKPLVWLEGEIKTPPFSPAARIEAGFLLRRLQCGDKLSMPHARTMSSIGRRCMELRIPDSSIAWRIVVRVDADAVVIAGIFSKKTAKMPKQIMEKCRQRLRDYDHACQ